MAFKVRRPLKSTGGTRIGNTETNYTDFATNGRQTMAGTGQIYKDLWLPAAMFYGIEPNQFANAFNATAAGATCTPSVRPFDMDFGKATGSKAQIPVLSASTAASVDARAATVFWAPPDAAATGSVAVWLYYTTKLAMGTAGSKQVFRVNSVRLGTGGSALGANGNGASAVAALAMGTLGLGKLEAGSIGLIPSFSQASPLNFIQLTIESSHATCGMAGSPEESIFGVRLRYVANSLGAAV